jgi:hypothetical protein
MTTVKLPTLDIGVFDPSTDTITIEGTLYAGALFRDGFGGAAHSGQILRIDKRDDGVVTITRLRDLETLTKQDVARRSLSVTLYVVTSGEYSDYRVRGIYSTHEKAEQARDFFNTENDIEEHEIDALPEHPPGMLRYTVLMDRDGRVDSVARVDAGGSYYEWTVRDAVFVGFHVWARDETHAIKIANDRRAQLLASNLWTTDWGTWHRHKATGMP